MPDTVSVNPTQVGFRIKKIGLIDFSKLYLESREFFDDYKYIFHETQHKSKDTDKGRKLDIKWLGYREVDKYAKFQIKVNIVMFGIKEVKGLYSTEMYVYIDGNVILDYKNQWEISRFRSFLFKFYNRYIIRRDIINYYFLTLSAEVNELRGRIKASLDEYD
ncbi:hypothetical protein J4455_00845 [Candidatus Woesearchaeota archaeon]|nr:hypothetical protein [Candidatus Woesearchaeota archaeon]